MNYAEAKAERDKQSELEYETGEVMAVFEAGVTDEQIAEIVNYVGNDYDKVISNLTDIVSKKAKYKISLRMKKTMKRTKRFGILLYALCFLCMASALPVAAKSESAPKKLVLSRREITLYVGESKKLLVEKAKPVGASAKVTWKSKRQKVAVVSRNGKVTAKKKGKTTILAISKKNPSVRAAVQVSVQKAPVKKEKRCAAVGKFYKNSDAGMLRFHYRRTFSDKHLPDKIVLRSSEDFQEMKKIWKKNSHTDFKKTCIAEYENMDFTKESLVLLNYVTSPRSYDLQMESLTTSFDASGKLCGVLGIRGKISELPPGMYAPAVMDNYTLAIRLDKRDEAMIDYYSR